MVPAMALVSCRECQHEISDEASACPQCGARAPKKSSGWGLIIGLILAVPVGLFVLLVLVAPMLPETERGRAQKQTIESLSAICERDTVKAPPRLPGALGQSDQMARYKACMDAGVKMLTGR